MLSSLRSSLESRAVNRQETANNERFAAIVADMLAQDVYSLDVFKKQFIESARLSGITGWMSVIPGMTKPGADEVKRHLKILDAFTPDELRDASAVDKDVRARVAAASATNLAEVNVLLRQYENHCQMHRWLKRRKDSGAPVPTSATEMHEMIQNNRSEVAADQKRRRARRR